MTLPTCLGAICIGIKLALSDSSDEGCCCSELGTVLVFGLAISSFFWNLELIFSLFARFFWLIFPTTTHLRVKGHPTSVVRLLQIQLHKQ